MSSRTSTSSSSGSSTSTSSRRSTDSGSGRQAQLVSLWARVARSPWTVACVVAAVVVGPSAATASALDRANAAPPHSAPKDGSAPAGASRASVREAVPQTRQAFLKE
ncbi:hypothetical protein ACIOKD_09145 [Streptomyces sp. NPDC087844]|uniref:hypothetical protein n=1 Tax=Streptomyces sp. NPDC087844 TaxID=3365805 RepID=UPI00380F2AE5